MATKILARQYAAALRKINIALPVELVQEILDIINRIRFTGMLRMSDNGMFSVYDYIQHGAGKTNPRRTWKDLIQKYEELEELDDVRKTYSAKVSRSDGKAASSETPVTDILGLLIIQYLLPGELGDRLRVASAKLVLATASGYFDGVKEKLEGTFELNAIAPDASDAPPLNPFPYTWEMLWKDSGIVDKYQVRDAIIRDFIDGKHYRWSAKALEISAVCYQILMLNFRAKKEADVVLDSQISE